MCGKKDGIEGTVKPRWLVENKSGVDAALSPTAFFAYTVAEYAVSSFNLLNVSVVTLPVTKYSRPTGCKLIR